jgi:glutamate-ammonia-ligase adenylyltransferase
MTSETTLAAVPFADPARARANFERLAQRLPERLFSFLPTLLPQIPDPDGALNHLERLSQEAGPRVYGALERQPALLHYLLALFSCSRFLSETLLQQPDLILWLGRERQLDRWQTKEELLEEYARLETAALEVEPSLALARFKRRQYLRITLKDILGISSLVETTLELSTLADVLLEKALTLADAELRRRFGAPQTTDGHGRLVPARFAVIALGKLGGAELNYSSDIDLLFLYDGEGETCPAGGGASAPGAPLSNPQYFIRLAQRLLQLIAGVTREGAVFRVDLRLRPGGGEGDLAISLPAALDYYTRRAREWELQMLLKARHSTGDAALVREFLTGVEPHLFRGGLHFAAVEAVLQAREQIDRKLDAAGRERLNVKLAPGGIRDIEFLVQCLQRLFGRDDPWVRAGGTLVGLQKLYEKGYLAARDHQRLASAYQFLRLVEHRLQLEQGQQTHTLPESLEALELLARRCGVAPRGAATAAEEFSRRLEEHLRRVREIYRRALPRAPQRGLETAEFSLRPPAAFDANAEPTPASLAAQMRALGSPLAEALERLVLPERARRPLQKFLAAALASSELFEEVGRRAAALPRVVEILRSSEPFGAMLIRHPERLRVLEGLESTRTESGRQLGLALPPEGLAGAAALQDQLLSAEALAREMAYLRRSFADALFRWGAADLCLARPVESSLREYTRLAEEGLRAAYAAARPARGAEPVAVLALGRLGTCEMDLGSDADVVFVVAEAADQPRARQSAELMLHIVSAYTREGTLFPLDVRLRPRGGEGELVQTLEGIVDYFARAAQVWEAATYLKARPVAGDPALGEYVCQRLTSILGERFSRWPMVRDDLLAMRKRLEEESAGALEVPDNFKTGPGGAFDLEFILAAWALRAGARPLGGLAWPEQIEALAPGSRVIDATVHDLKEAARFFREVDHAVRLVTGRNAPWLPAGPRLESVVELVGRWRNGPWSGSELLERLAATRRRLRALFEQTFGD